MRTASRAPLAALALLALGAGAAAAQSNNANISVTAAVQQPINVTGAVGLSSGNVFPGVTKTILVTDAGAGRFDVTAEASTPVNMTFVLPTNLTSGANLLPVGTFSGNFNTTNAPTGTGFTPSTSATTATASGTGQLFVFVGATVTPATTQAAGTYTGSVQLTVVY